MNQIARSDSKIILGDFNVKVSKESMYKPTIGNARFHNETNKIKSNTNTTNKNDSVCDN
jgi:hypothetical protein